MTPVLGLGRALSRDRVRPPEPEEQNMPRRRKGEDIHGWIVLDKPLDMTSTQAVSAVRRVFNAKKAGHA